MAASLVSFDVPTCAVSCLNDAIAASGCAVDDGVCICADVSGSGGQAAAPCLIASCPTDDLIEVQNAVSAACASVGTATTSTSTSTSTPPPTATMTTTTSSRNSVFTLTPPPPQSDTPESSESSSKLPTNTIPPPPIQSDGSTTGGTTGEATSGGLSTGAKAGIAVSAVAVVILAAAFWIFIWRRRKARGASSTTHPHGPAELDPESSRRGAGPAELANDDVPQDLSGIKSPLSINEKSELVPLAAGGLGEKTDLNKQTLTTTPGLLSSTTPTVSELPIDGSQPMPPELYTSTPSLAASQVPSELYSSGSYQYQYQHQYQQPSPGITAEPIPGNMNHHIFPLQNPNPPPPTWETSPPPPTNITTPPTSTSIEQREAQDELEQLLRQEAELERRRKTLVELRSIEEEQAALREQIKAARAQVP
ncbi:hypothetical protein V8F33_008231 [Rhypophila sp. PSN 637]